MTEMCRNILENCEEFRRNNLENLGNFHLKKVVFRRRIKKEREKRNLFNCRKI